MITLLIGSGLFLIPFAIHIISWRAGLVSKSVANIIRIFVISWLICFSLYAVCRYFEWEIFDFVAVHPGGLLHSMLFSISLFTGYLLTYPGIEKDSPSGSILLAVQRAGTAGLKAEDLEKALADTLNDEEVIVKRLADLQAGNIISSSREGKGYSMTYKGKLFLNLFTVPRKLFTTKEPKG